MTVIDESILYVEYPLNPFNPLNPASPILVLNTNE